jgi:hypothetical protein
VAYWIGGEVGRKMKVKLSELKTKVKILKKYGYSKQVGFPSYFKVYRLNQWNLHQCISGHDLIFSRHELEDYLNYLYAKNMKLLFSRLLEEHAQKNA